MAEGEFALVREHGEAALTRSSQGWATVGDHELYGLLADAAALQRDKEALSQYVPLAEESAKRYDHKSYQAIAHRARSATHRMAGEYVEAELQLNQALDIFNDMNARYQIGRTFFELGELALTRADTTIARESFTRALSEFETIGALPDVIRTHEKLELVQDNY